MTPIEGRCSDAATFRAVPGSINGSWVLHHGLPPRVMSAEPTQVPLVLPSAAPSDRWAAEVQPEPIENEKAQKPSKRWRVHAEVYRRNTGKASTSIKHEEKSPVMWAATYGEAVRNDDSWEVESVVQFRSYYRKEQWLVKWKGYGEDRNTWEPWENLLTEKAQEEALAVKEAASSGGR